MARSRHNRRLKRALLAAAALLPAAVLAQNAGSFEEAGDTLVSAMMLFVGNDEKVYILDKAEMNAAQINGHPAWGSVFDIATRSTTLMDVTTNVFCASGMHLPNGSFITLGGNGAVGPGGALGSVNNGFVGSYDATVGVYDGRKAIRIVNPCTGSADSWNSDCLWYDNPSQLAMQKNRWYSAAEPLGDGTVAIIGGFVNGGYINRNYPNTDPAYEGGAAEPTYEFFPSRGQAQVMQFMVDTSGLNSYAHTFLLASGKMYVQANTSSIIWDPDTNEETALPEMPNGVIRVYPASGATAMMPLLPEENYEQTVLFCGGFNNMDDEEWGDYSYPKVNTWERSASADCQRIKPQPQDGSSPTFEQDDDMIDPRTMGQFILLPDGTMLVVNGGRNGTAGYSTATGETPLYGNMAFGMSLASEPVYTPAIYNPSASKGSRWSDDGLGASTIPRLYHSSAVLLPDGSVFIAGSNPNVDVNTSTVFPTEYRAEIFYPPYFGKTRPQPEGVPTQYTYGGDYFNITVPASSYSGSANDAAGDTRVWLIRQGFTTHAMNMGQRALALNNTYTVNSDGSITLHVSQPPPNPNLLQPGPVFTFVTVKGVPSNGTYGLVGNGQIGTQPTSDASPLPDPVKLDSASGSADNSSSSSSSGGDGNGDSNTGIIIGGIVGAVVLIGLLGAGIGICMKNRRARGASSSANLGAPGASAGMGMGMGGLPGTMRQRDSDATMMPLQDAYGAHNVSFSDLRSPSPYKDNMYAYSAGGGGGGVGGGYGGRATPSASGEFDPYTHAPMRQGGGY